MKRRAHNRKSGQIVVALVVMLLALLVLALMNVDTFLAVRGRARMTNACDAAALAAAHWQGVTLNLVGELNLARLDSLCKYADDPEMADEIAAGIVALQERLAFAGPMMALRAASAAAKRNYADENEGMSRIVGKSIDLAMKVEPSGTASWPGLWRDYAEMLAEARGSGLCAGCDNANLFDIFSNFSDGHVLHYQPFYSAVSGKDWCWFFRRRSMYSLLRNFSEWPPLGEPLEMAPDNPEYFGVGFARGELDDEELKELLPALADRYNLPSATEAAIDKLDLSRINSRPWFQYDLGLWRTWTEMDSDGHDFLPILSPPKDEYNILGATAAVRTSMWVPSFTPNISGRAGSLKELDARRFVTEERIKSEEDDWMAAMAERFEATYCTAAAKPFGCREGADGREPVTYFDGRLFPLVTPDFTAVRLIPIAGSSGGSSTADVSWIDHMRDHLPEYMNSHSASPGCKWCAALAKWDRAEFRQAGVDWLKSNSEKCVVKGGGHYTPKGGTRHAH